MNISGFQKLTLLDYPNKTACIIFTQGCNFKCSYCQNSSLIPFNNDHLISEKEILEYLKNRKNLIDGIVISGGEPTVQKNLVSFIKKVKELNVLVKLDTNGTNPSLLKELIDNKLVDYVAMDIKHSFNKYSDIIKCITNIDNIKKSIAILKNSSIDYEFRTTIIKYYHTLDDILNIINYIGDSKYYLQNFKDSEDVIDKGLRSFTDDELKELKERLKDYSNVSIRGL